MKRLIPIAIVAVLIAAGVAPSTQAGGGGPSGSVYVQEDACGRPREPGEIAVLGRTTPAVDQGTVQLPELDLTSDIVSGCFEFRNLILTQDPMLVSFEIRVEGYRPTTWANYLPLGTRIGPNFTPRLELGDEPKLIDPCPELLATPQDELSAAGHQHARLCEQLADAGTFPQAGGGGPVAGSGSPVASELLVLVGAALLCAGASIRLVRGLG